MDRAIDAIPEELLIEIISFLDFKEAVRTSIISHNLRNLWKYIPNLILDANNVLSYKTNDMCKAGFDITSLTSAETTITSEFINNVDFILGSHQGSLESLVLRFFLEEKHESYLDKWISIAIASRTKKLVLDVKSPSDEPYKFPCNLFSGGGVALEFLELKFCSLKLPVKDFVGFKNLETLILDRVDITDTDIENFLPILTSLKNLHFDTCVLLHNLKIPSLNKLEVLDVEVCGYLKYIECHAPNLCNFKYIGNDVLLDFEVLEEANIYLVLDHLTSSYVIMHLPKAIAYVKTLELQIAWELEGILNLQDKFLHLKHLTITNMQTNVNYSATTLIKAAPFLETFALELWGAKFEDDNKKIVTPPKCPHKHLRTVDMIGFTGYTDQLELLSFLLTNATTLERMSINTSTRFCKDGDEIEESPLEVKIAKEIFTQYLGPLVPQHITLLLL